MCIFVRDNSLLSFEVSHLLAKDDDSMLLLWGEFCKKEVLEFCGGRWPKSSEYC